MKIDDFNKVIWVRQSWLNDLLICPERARLGLEMPDWRTGSEATAIGTGMHTAIQEVLEGDLQADMSEFVPRAEDAVFHELGAVRREDYSDEEVKVFVASMSESFLDGILPDVELGGECEGSFAVTTNALVGGYRLGFTGTMDYVTPSGVIWDWKTASRAYSYTEKQKMSIQASVYALAMQSISPDLGYPVDFRYGVMLRQAKPKAQIVYTERSANQIEWLIRQAANAVRQCMHMSHGMAWLQNDQHNLCSEKWCPYWSVCKGAHVQSSDMIAPRQK